MDPETKKLFDEIKVELGKKVEAVARVEKLEKQLETGATELKAVRTDLEKIRTENAEREKAIEDLKRAGRVQAVQRDDKLARREAMEMLGMLARRLLCRHINTEMPSTFKDEIARVDAHLLQRATLYAGGTTGSYLVPTITERDLIDALEEVSELLSGVEFIPGLPAAGTIYIPTLTARPTLQPKRATVDTAMTQSDPTFGQLAISPDEAYIYFPVDNRLIQMSALDLGSLLNRLLRDAIIEGLCTWLLNGDATSSYNSIRGILNETAGYCVSLPAGKKNFADLTPSDMRKAKSTCLKRGRARGVWLASLEVQGLMEDMDRTGKVPVITYGQNGEPRAMQSPIVIDEGMPDLADNAAAKAFLGFGDLATYIVGLVGGIQIAASTEYLFGKNQTALRGVINGDIKRKPVLTFVTVKTAAA